MSDDETQFSPVVPTTLDQPIHLAGSDDNTGVPCADCTNCLCGVSLDLVMSGLLVRSRTQRDRVSPNAGSVHPDPRNV